jgi:hypothetical protein
MGVISVCSACDVTAVSTAEVTPIPDPSPIKGEGG